jgi:hypothetical protein
MKNASLNLRRFFTKSGIERPALPRKVKYPSRSAAVSEKTRCVLIGALAVDSRPEASRLLVSGQRQARTGQEASFARTVA